LSSALRFALVVGGPAYGSEAASLALLFARELVDQGHRLVRVFFYQEGVHNANLLTLPANDEADLVAGWRELAERSGAELAVCVAAAQRRGLLDRHEADQAGLQQFNLVAPFELSGLGQLAEAALTVDRLVQF